MITYKVVAVSRDILETNHTETQTTERYWGYGSQAVSRRAHAFDYTYADARAIADWLNDRASGYPAQGSVAGFDERLITEYPLPVLNLEPKS